MAAILAQIFSIAAAPRQKADAMRGKETHQRMPDFACAARRLQETVPAVTRVFHEAVARRDRRNTVAEQPARISDLLGKVADLGKSVGAGRKDQGMTATDAHVLVHAVALGQAYIRVMPKKTGERVAHMRGLAILPQVLSATAAARDGHPPQHLVVDDVTPDSATEAHPERRVPGGILHDRPRRILAARRLNAVSETAGHRGTTAG